MTTDFRALCVELTDCLEKADWPHKQKHVFEQWIYIARKALAEPEPEGTTKDELWELWLRLNNELPDRPAAVAEFWEHARVYTLARWGRPAPQPADGEAAELVAWLEEAGRLAKERDLQVRYWRIATLLERLSPPQPVPVSDRLPGPEDCNVNGYCWWWYPEVPNKTYGYWAYEEDAMERAIGEQPIAWLPAHAMSFPS